MEFINRDVSIQYIHFSMSLNVVSPFPCPSFSLSDDLTSLAGPLGFSASIFVRGHL